MGVESSKKLRENVQRVAENDRSYVEVNCENWNVGDRGAEALAEALRSNTRVRMLKLGGCEITHVGAQALADTLGDPLKKSKLLRLEFTTSNDAQRGNPLGNSGAIFLTQILRNASAVLQHLVVNKCGIGDEGAAALAEALQANYRLLTIHLGENCISDKGAESLGRCLAANRRLQGLSLWHNRIFADGAEALAEGLRTNSSLVWLGLGCNHIGDIGAKALAHALHGNAEESRLNWLALGGNSISDRGVTPLAGMLMGTMEEDSEAADAKLCKIESLGLGGNAITDVGAKRLAGALKRNTVLKSLGLADNRIGDEGALLLADALLESETLEKLIVSGNEIKNEGASQLAAALAKNQSLQSLFLAENEFNDEAGKRFVEVLARHNKTLKKLDIHNSAMTDSGMKEVVSALQDTGLTSLGGEVNRKRPTSSSVLKTSVSGNIIPDSLRKEKELPTEPGATVFHSPTASWGQSAKAMDSLPSVDAAAAAVKAFQAAGQHSDDDNSERKERIVRKAANKFLSLRLLAQKDDEMAQFDKEEMETSFIHEAGSPATPSSPFDEFDQISGSASSSFSSLSHPTKDRPKQLLKRRPSPRGILRSASQNSTNAIPEEKPEELTAQWKESRLQILKDRVERLKGGESLQEEFQRVLTKDADHNHDFRAALLPENRYKNHESLKCLPPEHSRVKMTLIDGAQGSGYINASYVRIPNCPQQFIIAQSPLEDTYQDFWRMIWEKKVRMIVMLTKTLEKGEIKCEEYWPDYNGDGDEYGLAQSLSRGKAARWIPGGLKVISSPLRNEIISGVKARDFVLEETSSGETRTVVLYQYTEWPDHEVPNSTAEMTDFVKFVMKKQDDLVKDAPILIHGFLGMGRSGSFCCILTLVEMFGSDEAVKDPDAGEFSLDSVLAVMRQQRPGLVETVAQYEYIHRVIHQVVCNVDEGMPEDEGLKKRSKPEKKKGKRTSWFGGDKNSSKGNAGEEKKRFSFFGRKSSSAKKQTVASVNKVKKFDDALY
eukprot:m.8893 g.8893  ORF g.8893 m.8893 type:complete len:1005 (+) comp20952_c0_seq2:2-3016(+)